MADDDDVMEPDEDAAEFEGDETEPGDPEEFDGDEDSIGDDDEFGLSGDDEDFSEDTSDDEDDEDDDDDTSGPARRSTAGDDEDEDDDLTTPDDVEADLDTILKDRLVAAEDEDDEDEEPEERGEAADRLQPKRADEELCPSCFLLVRRTAPMCPVGDDECPLFSR